MKLNASSQTFNLGDTSFRRKTLIDDYKELLPFLAQNNEEFPAWDKEAQSAFYLRVLERTNLFNRNKIEDPAKRARTLTNALVKLGMANDKRQLSPVAEGWRKDALAPHDDIEKVLNLDSSSLLFLRQLLKLKVYGSDEKFFFYPFRIGLLLLEKYINIPEKEFLAIIHLIQPGYSEDIIKEIVKNYGDVRSGKKTFAEFVEKFFSHTNESNMTKEWIQNGEIDKVAFF
ncbi:MAG: hypothetical protein QM571_00330 [Micrococcaceae bacterium]